jgi:hypothetical protein
MYMWTGSGNIELMDLKLLASYSDQPVAIPLTVKHCVLNREHDVLLV